MPRTLAMARVLLILLAPTIAAAADAPPAKVTFAEVSAIFQQRCNSCHNADKQKGGLSLDTYGTAMQGGASGKVVEPGDLGSSRLWALVSHAEQPNMPPKQQKLPDAELDAIKRWIEAGAPESASSAGAPKKPKLDFKLDPSAIGKPIGPPAMPEGVPTEPAVISARPNAITALAASPWAPLVAISGHKQVLLYNTANRRLVGVLPFPEGTVHCLRFTRDGGLILAGGGRGGQSGRVVVWDVKTGKRLFEVGKEYDAVLAADLSPDRSLVALGGPSKILRVYGTGDGELVYESKKHTEWVTAVEFSPDGVLLASGDRNGGLVVWEANTGREFYDLRGHSASITDVTWRLDSNVLASASEDTTVRLWEMQNGGQVKAWGAHGGGVASVRFAKDGRLVTTGRDRVAKVWDQNGGQQRQLEPFADLALRAVFTHDDASVIAGDWSGEVRIWELKEGKRLGNLAANPAPLAVRLETARQAAAAAQSAADAAARELAALQSVADQKAAAIGAAQRDLAAAQKAAGDAAGAVAAAEQALAQKGQAERTAADVAWSAGFAEWRANALRWEAAADVYAKADAARGAADVLAATGSARERLLAERSAASLVAASRAAEALTPRLGDAVAGARTARETLERATADRVAAEAPLPALRLTASQAASAVPARQAALAAATSAKQAADKAVADRAPAVQSLQARVRDLQAEAEALATEKKARDATATASAKP
jgi:WD40 repeat protein